MPKHVRTSIREALVFNIKQIKTKNGFNVDMSDTVGDPPRSLNQMAEFPFTNLEFEEETNESVNFGHSASDGQNKVLIYPNFIVKFIVVYSKIEDPTREYENILHDVQKKFGENFILTGEDGNRTIHEMIYNGSDFFEIENDKPTFVAEIDFKIWYRQLNDDPTTLG